MKREFLRRPASIAGFLGQFRLSALEAAPPRSIFRDIAIPAIAIAFPLLAFGYLLLGWLDADDALKRRAAQAQAGAVAHRIETAMVAALDAKSHAILARIDAVRRESNPTGQLRQMIYAGEISYLLIRRGSELVFPSREDWSFADVEDQRRQLLTVASDLYSRLEPPQGWYAGLSGVVYFRCTTGEPESICFALDEAVLRPDLLTALSSVVQDAPDWVAQLRDPYNRVFWGEEQKPVDEGYAFPLSGALRGWTLQVGAAEPKNAGPRRILITSVPFAVFWIYFVLNLGRRQSEKLVQAERKKAFLDKIAHDLRTPLANLKLFCELVAQETRGNARAQDHCAILAAEVDRLDAVAANAMAFGRSAPPQMRKAIPDDVLQLVLERFSPRFAACNSLCTIAESEMAPMLFDVAAYERILVNLLDNACKYAPGAISVATRFDAGWLRLEVDDHGPGLRPADFVTPSGSGLGLSIVSDLASANGGRVTLIDGREGLHVMVTLKATRIEGNACETAGG
jgi:signal transduction histidine kinase